MIFSHTWSENFKIKITYETKIFESFFKKEQRRALRTYPKIEMARSIILEKEDARKMLSRNFNNVVYIPLDMEVFSGVRGTKTVTSDVSLTNFFFLNNLNNVYLIDDDENRSKVTSIVGKVINLDASILGTGTIFYPCLKCFIKSLNFNYETDTIISLGVTAEQVKEA